MVAGCGEGVGNGGDGVGSGGGGTGAGAPQVLSEQDLHLHHDIGFLLQHCSYFDFLQGFIGKPKG